MKKEIIQCDICKKESFNKTDILTYSLQVIFTTEQNEGKSVEPYLDNVNIEMCNDCYKKLLETRTYIIASGVMGHNTYKLG